MQNHEDQCSVVRGAFGMPKPQGWVVERIVHLLAGAVVLVSLVLGRTRSSRWRVLTGFVGANLMLEAVVGWCPMSVLLHRCGIPSTAEYAQRRNPARIVAVAAVNTGSVALRRCGSGLEL